MSNTIFYSVGIAFASGIFFRSFFDVGYTEIYLLVIVGAALLVAWRIQKHSTASHLFIFGLTCVVFSLGVFRLHVDTTSVSELKSMEDTQVLLEGIVVKEPEIREKSTHLYVSPRIEGREIDEKILLIADRFEVLTQDIRYGDSISVEGELKQPKAFETDSGREFDYPRFLKTRGVDYTISYGRVTFLEHGETSLFSVLYRGKQKFMDTLEGIVPAPHSGLGEGLLLGVKRAIGTELDEAFRKTGIIHIVVLSGYNVMIVVEAMLLIFSFFFAPRIRMVIGISAIVLFAILVGPSATVVRASVMAGLLLIARATGRVYAVLRALLLAGVVMLIINPYLLVHDPGFQLSFLATLGLILLSPFVEKKLTRIPTTLGIRGVMTATISTQIIVLPLLLYQTGLFSVVSVLVNVLVLPMVPFAMLLTFLTGTLGMVSNTLGIGVGFLTYHSLGYIITIAEFFGSLPAASVSVEHFSFTYVAIAYAAIIVFIIKIWRGDAQKNINARAVSADTSYDNWVIEEEKDEPSMPFK